MMKLNLSPRNCFQNFRVSRTTTKNLLSITFESNCGAVWPQNGFVHIFGISATFCNSINIKAIARAGGAIVGLTHLDGKTTSTSISKVM